jgi:hypothetical protein
MMTWLRVLTISPHQQRVQGGKAVIAWAFKPVRDSTERRQIMDTIWNVSPPDYPHSQCFDEIALGLRAAFRVLGAPTEIVCDPAQLGEEALVLGANLLSEVRVPSSARLTLFNLEQITPDSPWLTHGYLGLLRRQT